MMAARWYEIFSSRAEVTENEWNIFQREKENFVSPIASGHAIFHFTLLYIFFAAGVTITIATAYIPWQSALFHL